MTKATLSSPQKTVIFATLGENALLAKMTKTAEGSEDDKNLLPPRTHEAGPYHRDDAGPYPSGDPFTRQSRQAKRWPLAADGRALHLSPHDRRSYAPRVDHGEYPHHPGPKAPTP